MYVYCVFLNNGEMVCATADREIADDWTDYVSEEDESLRYWKTQVWRCNEMYYEYNEHGDLNTDDQPT